MTTWLKGKDCGLIDIVTMLVHHQDAHTGWPKSDPTFHFTCCTAKKKKGNRGQNSPSFNQSEKKKIPTGPMMATWIWMSRRPVGFWTLWPVLFGADAVVWHRPPNGRDHCLEKQVIHCDPCQPAAVAMCSAGTIPDYQSNVCQWEECGDSMEETL